MEPIGPWSPASSEAPPETSSEPPPTAARGETSEKTPKPRLGAPFPPGPALDHQSATTPFPPRPALDHQTATTDQHAQPRSALRRRLGPLLAALAALLAKLKAVLLLLPKLKILTTGGTMLVSMAAYTVIWGWRFGVGFVLLILVHEMGHVIALRREGIKASAPLFIPFLGAVVGARSLGDDALAEARVGLAGPVLGTLGALACVVLWQATGSDLFRALAFIGFFLNLLNLVPVIPLDGGRAMAAMAPWMWLVGFAILVPLIFLSPNPLFVLILVLAAVQTFQRLRARRTGGEREAAYYRVRPLDRLLVAAVYLSLIGLLAAGMHATNLPRTLP